jgi:hypothetical protein
MAVIYLFLTRESVALSVTVGLLFVPLFYSVFMTKAKSVRRRCQPTLD